MKNLTLLTLFIAFQTSFSQNVCITDQESSYEDINQISMKKCVVSDLSTSTKITNITKEISVVKKISNKKNSTKKVIRVVKSKNNKIKNSSNTIISNKSLELKEIKNNIANIASLIIENKKIISFIEVAQIPFFISTKKVKHSFNEEMITHIKNNLNYPKEAVMRKVEGSVLVDFVIDTDGKIRTIKASSDIINSDVLKKEAIRIISLLPKFTPGKHKGKKVNVSYSFYMDFSLS
ncbi:energy transducer TonB [Tenacibaculum aestuariivivum]|uniref:energy transducer TonB n=1 Tax=Tenacibaculum aestuariivivum TaxID=2006131 RepID=UPI003AB2A7D2